MRLWDYVLIAVLILVLVVLMAFIWVFLSKAKKRGSGQLLADQKRGRYTQKW